ncbi:MAG: hypothetical protein ACLQU3_03030 [Limisphaerales bacterium]
MKKSILSLLAAGGAVLLAAGCASTTEKAQYLPALPYEGVNSVALLDPGVQHSVTCTRLQEKTLPDGRLEVIAELRNLENRRIEVQANCVFKDQNGFSTGDETPFMMVILTEGATEDVTFDSMNNLAKKYTIRVRQAR